MIPDTLPQPRPIYQSPVQREQKGPTPWEYFAAKKGLDPVLVEKVWKAAEAQGMSPGMALALVNHESGFKTDIIHVNEDRTLDYGLFQLNSHYHPQFKENVDAHIQYGMKYLADNIRRYGTEGGLGVYNAGAGQSPETQAKRAAYTGRVMASYKDVERTMIGYRAVNPKFQLALWSPQELVKKGVKNG